VIYYIFLHAGIDNTADLHCLDLLLTNQRLETIAVDSTVDAITQIGNNCLSGGQNILLGVCEGDVT
jgi:hypothetical protein